MKLISLLFALISFSAFPQEKYKVWFDTAGIRQKYHSSEIIVVQLKIRNNTEKMACFHYDFGMITPDGYDAKSLDQEQYKVISTHGKMAKKEDYLWNPQLYKKGFDCDSSTNAILPYNTYTILIPVQYSEGSVFGIYSSWLFPGSYFLKTALSFHSGENMLPDYPHTFEITSAPVVEKKKLSEIYETIRQRYTTSEFNNMTQKEKAETNRFLYDFLDTCRSKDYRDHAFSMTHMSLYEQRDVEKLVSYFPKITKDEVLLQIGYQLVEELQASYHLSDRINRYESFKLVISYMNKRNPELAEAFWGELFRKEGYAKTSFKKYYPQGLPYLLTNQQLTSLYSMLKK